MVSTATKTTTAGAVPGDIEGSGVGGDAVGDVSATGRVGGGTPKEVTRGFIHRDGVVGLTAETAAAGAVPSDVERSSVGCDAVGDVSTTGWVGGSSSIYSKGG